MTLLLICGLAVARLTRLWRDDTITETARDWVDDRLATFTNETGRRARMKRWLSKMLWCPWCFSGWLSAGVVIVVDSATSRGVAVPALAWLAVWWIGNLGYWLLELVADHDALAWHEREEKDIV